MKVAFYGSSLLSSYWNGAATYYRGLLSALARRGYDIVFYEPDAFDRQQHRDIDPPDWATSRVYPATRQGLAAVLAEARSADVVIKASGVGVFDDELLAGIMREARADAIRIFWDVDAAATIAELRKDFDHPLRRALPRLDAVLTYGGGPPIVSSYRELGARFAEPVYNALDPATHHPVIPDLRFSADLAFLGNRLPDREARVEEFFLSPARSLPSKYFLMGGNGWEPHQLPGNVRHLGHVYCRDHNAFNATPLAVLNIARDSMAAVGFSPATRVFEAAGTGACIITDAWEGIELFLKPGEEILVARDGKDVAAHLETLTLDRAREIGRAALARVKAAHTYELRAAQVDSILRRIASEKAAKGR